jgi:DNA polymerase-1
VVRAPLDVDGRIRTSYNVAGTVTFRLSSSESAFGIGTNLQNISSGGKSAGNLDLPNLRVLYIADPGYFFYEIDLSGADLQVVAWDSADPILKAWFRQGLDVHLLNARDLFGLPFDEGDLRVAERAAELKRLYHTERQFTKVTVHGTDYGGKARTMAAHSNTSVAEMERFQRRWFGIHPWIQTWQRKIESEITTRRYIFNQWGYRNFFFGRPEELLGEALAWIPQSTIAILINKIWEQLARTVPEVEVLLQVHDSLGFQHPAALGTAFVRERVIPATRVAIPYEDELYIPLEVKGPALSWGEAH